jgi:hypothetical protein
MSKQMTPAQALEKHEEMFDRAIEILKKKRVDYSGQADPFANFRQSEFWGVPAWKGALIRFMDKLTRFKNLATSKGKGAVDENIEDTIIDALNYLVISYELWLETEE